MVAVDFETHVLPCKKNLRLRHREIPLQQLASNCLFKAGWRFLDVHRKRPLDHHGPENARRKRPDGPILEAICAAHGGSFQRESARKSDLSPGPKAPERRFADLMTGRQTFEPEVAV